MFSKKLSHASIVIAIAASFIGLSACSKNSQQDTMPTAQTAMQGEVSRSAPKGTIFYALTNDQFIVKYSSGNPLTEISAAAITGLQTGEKVLSIDFRPATGQLYGVTNMSRLYTINQVTGKAVAVSMTPFSPAINGTNVGFDFNPTVDRIRLVTSSGQSLRLNPETGTVAGVDGSINPAGAAVTAVAYKNNVAGAATTTLYDIDAATDKLYIQSPVTGTLTEVGPLGIQTSGEAGFDIAPDNSVAIAALFGRGFEIGEPEESPGNKYRFYYINLSTGEAQNAGKTDREITGVAIPTNPVAYAVTGSNSLLIFNPDMPSIAVSKSITGLQVGETILGIDMRPAKGQLFGLGSSSRLYAINMANGAATAIGTMSFSPALNGTSFAVDFNPTVDRIRVISNTGQNLRLHPDLGTVAFADPNINPAGPTVDAAAYTNNFAGATSTTLYDIDFTTDRLFIQTPPNMGTVVAVGNLGVDISASNGFDIGGMSGKAWGIFTSAGAAGLYSVSLSTGTATKLSAFGTTVNGFAIGLGF